MTLNRPEVRNALDTALRADLRAAMAALDADDEVDVVVLTGADPAFCAGLDLKQLGDSGENLSSATPDIDVPSWFPWAPLTKPVIGAVNGVAVTGGLELALNCDILIASERARFADTHARVGVLPGWGMSVLLPLVGDGPRIEAATSAAWRAGFDPAEVARRRSGVIDRGRAQTTREAELPQRRSMMMAGAMPPAAHMVTRP